METLVAILIVIVVFSIASLSLQNIYGAEVKNNDDLFRNRLKELQYKTVHDQLQLPYLEDNRQWNIYIEQIGQEFTITADWKKGQRTLNLVWKQ